MREVIAVGLATALCRRIHFVTPSQWPMSCTIKDVATARRRQCPAEWWALRLILGVYSPLSIAVMQHRWEI
jgi:hypothetical protein